MNKNQHVLNLKDIGLPEDVIYGSGCSIDLIGEETGSMDEIIVILQDMRYVFKAFVCKITSEGNKYDISVPGYGHLIFHSMDDVSIRKINGKLYTMMCISSSIRETPNWLF